MNTRPVTACQLGTCWNLATVKITIFGLPKYYCSQHAQNYGALNADEHSVNGFDSQTGKALS